MSNKRTSKKKAKKKKIGRPAKYTSAESMQKIIDSYFEECDEKKRPYTVTGLAYALKLSRQGLNEYKGKAGFSDTITRAKQRVEMFLEELTLRNSCGNGVIFNLKNNFGWVDRQEIDMPQGIDIIVKSATEKGRKEHKGTGEKGPLL